MLLIAGGPFVPGDVQHLSAEVFSSFFASFPYQRLPYPRADPRAPLAHSLVLTSLAHASPPVENGLAGVLFETFVLTKLYCRAERESFPVRAARFATRVSSPSAGNICVCVCLRTCGRF